jgi:hypothetical protein
VLELEPDPKPHHVSVVHAWKNYAAAFSGSGSDPYPLAYTV